MNTKEKISKSLRSLAEIRFGIHSQFHSQGTISYLQARHFSPLGDMIGLLASFIDGDTKVNNHLLKDGDILMAGKGTKNFAWTYRRHVGPAVASTLFYVISVNKSIIYPEYLTSILNLPVNQVHFQKLSSSSSVASLRKKELEEFNVPLIPMEEQKAVAKLAELHLKEMKIAEELITLKQNLYIGTISKLIN